MSETSVSPPVSQPPPPPPGVAPATTYALYELGGTPAMVEFVVRTVKGSMYYETRWNEVETPEIARLFQEFTAAQGKLQ